MLTQKIQRLEYIFSFKNDLYDENYLSIKFSKLNSELASELHQWQFESFFIPKETTGLKLLVISKAIHEKMEELLEKLNKPAATVPSNPALDDIPF